MSLDAFSSHLLNSGASEVVLSVLQLTHVVILGAWMGAELVINASFRYAISATALPFPERDRVLTSIIKINQGVRYALVLLLTTGLCLVSLLGYLPFYYLWGVAFGLAWMVIIFMGHRSANPNLISFCKIVDRDLKLIVIWILLVVGGLAVAGKAYLPFWLGLKLVFFAGVIAAGLGIRTVFARLIQVWSNMREQGISDADNATSREIYSRVSLILLFMWLCVALISILSLLKPA